MTEELSTWEGREILGVKLHDFLCQRGLGQEAAPCRQFSRGAGCPRQQVLLQGKGGVAVNSANTLP